MKKKLSPFVIVIIILIIPAVLLFNMVFKRWYIFTDSRIERVEQVFNITLSEDTKPLRFEEKLMGQNVFIQNMYISGVNSPEEFVKNNIHGEIELSSDMNSADDELKADYGTEYWYDGTKRSTEFICIYKSGHYYTKAYFFKNNNGYDLKLIR